MLQVSQLSFQYFNAKETTLENLSFQLEKGKNLAIIGESGCGKSTLLQLIYGLYDVDAGEIIWNNQKVTGPKFNLVPGMPTMKYLAQDFDLMPYITVAENIGKYLSNFFPIEKQNRINELLEVVEMTEFAQVKAKYLSGGQMQRVALAKVLAKKPELLLLDEPFSHIDNFRKNSLRRRIFSYLKEKQITCIVATHDVNDSLSFADEILVMKNGKMLQKDTAYNVYNQKPTYYIASLFDEVSEIEVNGSIQLFYPHEIELVEKSNFEVVVKKSYFKGNYYLIETILLANQKTIFFNAKDVLQYNKTVCIQPKTNSK
ncbi:ABC transporter ATP-binding protein [Flavobacterium sp.]|uniref:ABC transporter ATP-binding protein n=1 Tax=Flavobacterium sp. TaxID=239 RepID=UPI0035284AF8